VGYIPGMPVLDSVGNAIEDGVANLIQEADEIVSNLNNILNSLYNSLIGTGRGDFWQGVARLYLSIWTGNPEWLDFGFTDPDVTDQASKVKFLYDWLEPGSPLETNLRNVLAAAIMAVRTDPATPHAPTVADVLAAIAASPLVTLPDPPPTGYGGGGISADDVWAVEYEGSGNQMGTLLARAGSLGWTTGLYGAIPLKQAPHFVMDEAGAVSIGWGHSTVDAEPPQPDYSDIRPTDTVLSWLNRTDPVYGGSWAADQPGGAAYYDNWHIGINSRDRYSIRCTLTDWDLQRLSVAPASTGAPVWPGLAGVTLGTPVTLASTVTITATMHGVILTLTSPPTKESVWPLGETFAYSRLGQIAFVSDRGEAEQWQWFQFPGQVITPKSMAEAAGCVIRSPTDAVGTVTPWTIA
jgi:hypothetical protein